MITFEAHSLNTKDVVAYPSAEQSVAWVAGQTDHVSEDVIVDPDGTVLNSDGDLIGWIVRRCDCCTCDDNRKRATVPVNQFCGYADCPGGAHHAHDPNDWTHDARRGGGGK